MSLSRLVASDIALRAVLLLSQRREGLRTSEVADELGTSYTGAEKALEILEADGLVTLSDHRYTVGTSARAKEAIRFALAFLPSDAAMASLARGNISVEFAGSDDGGILVVLRRFAEPTDEARFREAVALHQLLTPETQVAFVTKDDLRETLLDDLAPRRKALAMRVLAGTVDRTFPDRTQHGDFDAAPLGRLNDAVALPSGRRLRDFARHHGLRRILAFGSATRVDFRPDSDLDLYVEPSAGQSLGLDERVQLIVDAERLFGRDVDLLTAPIRRTSLAERISRDGVVLYESAR